MKKKYYCIDCGIEINWEYERCQSCAKKNIYKNPKNHPNWQGGLPKCIDCGKELSRWDAKRCQECFLKGPNHPRYGQHAPNGKRIWYNNIIFRSTWEVLFARFLDLSGIKYLYEPKRFYFKDCTYLPDFYVPEWDCYIEIKGYFSSIAKKKFEIFKRKFQKINIKMLQEKQLQNLGVL